MQNQNLIYLCILYQNGVSAGFIDKDGYICAFSDKTCLYRVGDDNKIHLNYRLKSYNRESIRIYHYPYFYLKNIYKPEDIEKEFERVEIAFECHSK